MPDCRPLPLRAIIVEERENPSTDYFVAPELRACGATIERRHWHDVPTAANLAGALVVFVRYVPAAWRRVVDQQRAGLAGIVYFMDDDILDTGSTKGLSLRYRYKLARFGAWNENWLRQVGASLWVATPWLAQKYADWQPRIIWPRPLSQTWAGQRDDALGPNPPDPSSPAQAGGSPSQSGASSAQSNSSVCRVFYHGTASHRDDIAWLYPVMREVLARAPNVQFEISGDSAVRRLYGSLPRASVVEPMRWPAYQLFMDQPGRHIGLAPLVDHPFNRSRSYTKFFDITRAGAAGIYARNGPWRELLESGQQGVLLPMQPDAWIDAIIALAGDAQRREAITAQARALAQRLAA